MSNDEKLFNSLMAEVRCITETLDSLESNSVSIEEAIGMIDGIQRDIVQLYREAA